jgi:catechol 2,3-dioxygenase-like lactoylglutathione lyase family enzyme
LAIVQRVAMIGFTVADIDRSVSFYSDVLSFEKLADFQVASPPYDRLQGCALQQMKVVAASQGSHPHLKPRHG